MRPSDVDPWRWIESVTQDDGDRPFLIGADGKSRSYGELFALSGRIAAALAARGVGAGDRVAVQVEKSPEAFFLYVACLRLGAVYVPLNTAYTVHEVEYFLGDAEPRAVVARPNDRNAMTAIAEKLDVAHVETLGGGGEGSLTELASALADDDFPPFDGDSDALASLLYTSGTTGRSKGAMLSRRNLAVNAVALVEAWRFTKDDVLLHALPVFHAHGLFIAGNTILASGASMIFLPRFDADEVIRLLPQATVMMGVPTFYTRLLVHPGIAEAAARVRLFVSGSAPLLAETHATFAEKTGQQILERYGMTETMVITSNPYAGARVPGSVGLPLREVEVRIADLESGEILTEPDAVGMIELRGPNLFRGYWRNPQKTAEDMRADGFFVTGDIGKIDAAGYVHIVGRAKDLIISGGYNVYPKEVEAEIDALDGVVESAVIGVPHPDFGEGVTAVVITHGTDSISEGDVLANLTKRLARYKVPKRVIFVAELPRNALGKVEKVKLRAEYAGLYRG